MTRDEWMDAIKRPSQIAANYADILEEMVNLNKRLITELSQYRAMDAEEQELEVLVKRIGGGQGGA